MNGKPFSRKLIGAGVFEDKSAARRVTARYRGQPGMRTSVQRRLVRCAGARIPVWCAVVWEVAAEPATGKRPSR